MVLRARSGIGVMASSRILQCGFFRLPGSE
jgi:hypothetical protein